MKIMEPKGVVAASQPQWIPVKERLPQECEEVVVYLDRGEVCVDYYSSGFWGYCDVTHWMPLPDPPKEADHES